MTPQGKESVGNLMKIKKKICTLSASQNAESNKMCRGAKTLRTTATTIRTDQK